MTSTTAKGIPNSELQAASDMYRWLRISPIFTVFSMVYLWWTESGYDILCRGLFRCDDDLWEWIPIASAIMLPSLWHIVLLVQVLGQKRAFARWHGWQALMLAGIRTAIPLCFVLADLWIRTNDARNGIYRSGYHDIYRGAFPFLFIAYFVGNTWGQTQALAGDCWLMRIRGLEKELPRMTRDQFQPKNESDPIYELEDTDGQQN